MYSDYYDLYETISTSWGIDFGTILAFMAGIWLILMIIAIFMIVCHWKIFKKAGRQGWEAVIPIYSTWVLFEIVGLKGWYVLLNFIPVVGSIIFFIFSIIASIRLAKCFGKDTAFGVGLIFIPFIFIPILAFDSSTYTKQEEVVIKI